MSNVPPTIEAITKVGIIGAGRLGSSIACDLSMHGVQVILYDRDEQVTKPAALQRTSYATLQPLSRLGYIPEIMVGNAVKNVRGVSSLEELASHRPQLIVESIVEDMDEKIQLFKRLEEVTPSTTILATSTITLNVNTIAGACRRPSNVLGVRFFLPCVLIPFVELTIANSTAPDVAKRVESYLSTLHKTCSYGPSRRVLNRADINDYQIEQSKALGYYHDSIPMATPIPSAPRGHSHH
ncbi:hypothetical protein AeMF1_017946 [Aphanomyces euteiches]|nr:hypothetical protein AeMF1_017946 [Aphanomyces euteiches]KAH9192565.1 hypothetical protein AeNC1_005451 [Aphanomyces euteiches]